MQKRFSARPSVKAYFQPRFRGKHVIFIAGRFYTAKTGKEASRLFDRLIKRYPGRAPTLTYVPKADTLIFTWLS